MIERLVEFVHTLRHSGVRVSMAEAMDAGEALRHTPITDRQIFKTTLQSVLVKEHQDIPAFDAAFERFFLVQLTDQDDLNGPESDENKESPETQPNLCNEQDDGEQEGEVTQEDGEQEASMPGEEEGNSSEEAEESAEEPDAGAGGAEAETEESSEPPPAEEAGEAGASDEAAPPSEELQAPEESKE